MGLMGYMTLWIGTPLLSWLISKQYGSVYKTYLVSHVI